MQSTYSDIVIQFIMKSKPRSVAVAIYQSVLTL